MLQPGRRRDAMNRKNALMSQIFSRLLALRSYQQSSLGIIIYVYRLAQRAILKITSRYHFTDHLRAYI